MILFTIIIPVYNASRFLPQCINSVLRQSYPDWELILIDDGATDNSGMICDDYATKDKRIKVYHKKNGGVSSARNLGIEKAKGKYISFIDSDDWIDPNYLKEICDKCHDIDLLFFSSIWHYNDGCKVTFSAGDFYAQGRVNVEEGIYKLIVNDSNHLYFGFTWNKLFRNDIIKQYNIRFKVGLSTSEDEIFTHDYAKYINNIKYVGIPLYNYRVMNSGLTMNKNSAEEWRYLSDYTLHTSTYYTHNELIRHQISIGLQRRWNTFIEEPRLILSLKNIFEIFKLYKKYKSPLNMKTFLFALHKKIFF